MGVSKNRGTPRSSILIGFSIINHPFWGTPIFGNTHIYIYTYIWLNSVINVGFKFTIHGSYGKDKHWFLITILSFGKDFHGPFQGHRKGEEDAS